MEASLVADTGQSGPLISLSSSPSPLAPSSAPSRPFRPKPPPPPTPKPPPNLSRSPSLSLPLSPAVKTPCFNPPPNLPPPLSPTPASPVPPVQQPEAAPPTKTSPTPDSSDSPFDPLKSPEAPALSLTEKLHQTSPIWRPKGLTQDQVTSILKEERPGLFLLHGAEEGGVTLSVQKSDQREPEVLNLRVKQHGAFLHLDGSFLVFDDIFKLLSFYCVSRDVLPLSLRLPQAITTATKREELEVIAATGKDFWTSDLHLQSKQDCSSSHCSRVYLHLNPVIVEENPITPDKPETCTSSKPEDSTSQNASSPLHNGETPEKVNLGVKVHNKPHLDTKYKRPPPRPPSVSSGTGLLFASTSSTQSSANEKKEEAKVVEDKTDKKITSNAPSRPPMPQSRAGPSVPRAPLRSSRKSSDREREKAEGMEREKGHNLTNEKEGAAVGEQGEEKSERTGAQAQLEKESGCQQQREEGDAEKDAMEDKQRSSSACLSVKKPSRPVPPPRRKPQTPESPHCPTQAGGGGGSRLPPPSPGRRPDVSLYSPQGGAVLVTDPDSASTSSTEEEAEIHEQSRAESRSPKPGVKRTPTTVMLGRARHRLSSVLTGLISHDRRLTQRLVELARDPSSYFGSLVKEHRMFTLETMSRHASSTELLQEIRQMMTQLKSYLLQSTELHNMMEPQHQYSQEKLESIAEAALCKSVLKPLREPIYQCLEKLHSDSGSLEKLAQNQSIVLGSTTTALGVTTAVPETSSMEKISIKLSNLHLEYSPQRKIEMLLKACKIIYDSMSVSSPGKSHGADDFLPVMMYVLARSNLSHLQLDVEYMMELMDPALTLGEGSYYLTTTYGALEHMKTFDQQRTATRQLSREVQDSIHRWERRRTLNKDSTTQGSVRDFLTVCCPIMGENPKTLGVLPTTTIEQLSEQCASRFKEEILERGLSDPDSYILSVVIDEENRPLVPSEVALSVKNSCTPGAYCFVYHPKDHPVSNPARTGPKDPPPAPPPTAPPNVPPPVPAVSPSSPASTVPSPPIRPPNVPPPIPASSMVPPSVPPPISAQKTMLPPGSSPVRPPNVPPPLPAASVVPPNIAPPTMPTPSSPASHAPLPVRPPNLPPPVPAAPSALPPKIPPPNVKPISVQTSVHSPTSPPSRPPNLPPPLPSLPSASSSTPPPSVPPPVPSPGPVLAPPSVPPPSSPSSASPEPSEAPPSTPPPPTDSSPPEGHCTSLGDTADTDPEVEVTEEGVLINL
ncbi:ras and Rab interactor 3 [Boleophthalmus pectinirostris]|uniref:ras and Rab interactor 3 n=1 Tax=Boleophthalmus pectinirostris TaxID=150288 RepID=UPI00242C450C|nr:ras and Rab interactor 3 [Boleophthalmus pectinirostris]